MTPGARISPSLPNELIEVIVVQLDPASSAGREALARLLCTSSAFWELAAPLLYHSLSFQAEEFIWLFDGLSDDVNDPEYPWTTPTPVPALSERKRRSLTFVRSLRLGGELAEDVLQRLVELSLPNTPMFHGVDKLCLAGANDLDYYCFGP